jgi:hypothetical protein
VPGVWDARCASSSFADEQTFGTVVFVADGRVAAQNVLDEDPAVGLTAAAHSIWRWKVSMKLYRPASTGQALGFLLLMMLCAAAQAVPLVKATPDRTYIDVLEGAGGAFLYTVKNTSAGNVQIDAVAASVPFFERGDRRDELATTTIVGDSCTGGVLVVAAQCFFSLAFTTVDNDVANSGTNTGLWRTGATVFHRKPGDPTSELDDGINVFVEVRDPGAVITIPEPATGLLFAAGLGLVSAWRRSPSYPGARSGASGSLR